MNDNELAGHLHQLVSLLSRESDQRLQEQLGIGLAQYKIISRLQHAPKGQQRAIAVELGQTEASISRQIKLLEERSLVLVSRNPNNLREHHIALTARGTQLIAAAERILAQYHSGVFAPIGRKQRVQFEEIIKNLHP